MNWPFAVILAISPFLVGCTAPPPLDDATLNQVSVASADDLAIYQQAKEIRRQQFGLPPIASPSVNWPVIRVSFRSGRQLFDPNDIEGISVAACHGDQRPTMGASDVMWKDRLILSDEAREIENALKDGPQTYEVFFPYMLWDRGQGWKQGDPIRLLPMTDDLCVSMGTWLNWPIRPETFGRPLRISRDVVNTVVTPFLGQSVQSHQN